MEMFNKKVLDQRIGPLKKSKNLHVLEDVEGYVLRKCQEIGLEHSYDVMAEEMPYFKTMGYTSYGTSFILQPLNLMLRTEQVTEAASATDTEQLFNYAGYLKNNIEKNIANKYQDREQNFKNYKHKDYLVVLPGSNKLKKNCCLNKMKHIAREHKGNIYFKPHPICTHAIIGEIKDMFGEESILPRNIDVYHFLKKAKKVYTTHISESCLYAVALGKQVEPIDVYQEVHRGSFYVYNKELYRNQKDGIDWINKTFSNYKSGVINPTIEKDWKKKVDKYFDYMKAKRQAFKHWYIPDRQKKK